MKTSLTKLLATLSVAALASLAQAQEPLASESRELTLYKSAVLAAFCHESVAETAHYRESAGTCVSSALPMLTKFHANARHFLVDFCVNTKPDLKDRFKGTCLVRMMKLGNAMLLPLASEIHDYYRSIENDCGKRLYGERDPACVKAAFTKDMVAAP